MADTGDESEIAQKKIIEEEKKEHMRLMEYNKKENERMLELREKRFTEALTETLDTIEQFKVEKDLERKLQIEEARKKIEETKELVKQFILKESLERAVEEAIANPTDYNFALDLEGYVYPGYSSKIEEMKIRDLEKLKPHIVETAELQPDV